MIIKKNSMDRSCQLCGQKAYFYCEKCGEDVGYCSDFCQLNDWRVNRHFELCGQISKYQLRYDQRKERSLRLSLMPLTVVGPFVYRRFNFRGTTYWLFGEFHIGDEKDFLSYKDRLDVKIVQDEKDAYKLKFSGSDPSTISFSRLMYAVTATANRVKEKNIDIFLEIRVSKGREREFFITDTYKKSEGYYIHQTAYLFRYLGCLQFDKEKEKECHIAPFVKVHYLDYRVYGHTIFEYGFSFNDHLATIFVSLYLQSKEPEKFPGFEERLKSYVQFYREFLEKVEHKYDEKSYRRAYLTYQNFVDYIVATYGNVAQEFLDKIETLNIHPKETYFKRAKTIITRFINKKWLVSLLHGKTYTNAKEEIDKLRKQDAVLATKLVDFFVGKEPTVLYTFFGLLFLDIANFKESSEFPDGLERDFRRANIKLTLWVHDAPGLARILRTHKHGSVKPKYSGDKFIYTGASHTRNFVDFFNSIQNDAVEIQPIVINDEYHPSVAVKIDEKDRKYLNDLLY